jgi:glycosyltransferase involved in cell wall biosynthesis
MPSKLEPSASVYVEAMHAGLPVVALRTGAVSELITDGDSGYLVDLGDVERLASVLTGLLDDPEGVGNSARMAELS